MFGSYRDAIEVVEKIRDEMVEKLGEGIVSIDIPIILDRVIREIKEAETIERQGFEREMRQFPFTEEDIVY